MKAYCVGCHTKKEMKDPKIIILKNGRLAMMAICLTCGTTIWHIKPILKSQKEKVKGLKRTAPKKIWFNAPSPSCERSGLGKQGCTETHTEATTLMIRLQMN